ncbi:MAG TPA: cysteine--tRNA ligase [Sorangium sp.]|nr:cysteine--tRNA ligase [Sorangium sp.]
MAAPFRIYNTLSRSIETFEPLQPGHVRLYVCGMTVYDHCHVGHARAMTVFDAFARYLRHRGWKVTFVRNITDVDDKIIQRAADNHTDAAAWAQRYVDSFHRDMAGLGLLSPDVEPRVTTSMPAILAMIAKLIERGHAYAADGSVWFNVETFADYGRLSNQKVEALRNPDDWAGKRKPADFAVWKAAKQGEPSWDSPWGPGRPGWHIECSAMASEALGESIDIHGGGLDLVFPHHENEIAQSEGASGKCYVRYWMHNGMLTMGDKKMGKSLGNVFNIHNALDAYPAEALRLYYLQNHYRSPLPWNDDALPDALGMLSRLYEAREKAEAMRGQEDAELVAKQLGADAAAVLALGRGFAERFYKALDQDFSTAQALGQLFELARAVNRFAAHKKANKRGGPVVAPALAAFGLARDALALMGMDTAAFHDEVKTKRMGALGIDAAAVEQALADRAAARQAKQWARADAIRDQLAQKNIEVLDLPAGVQWRVRLTSNVT